MQARENQQTEWKATWHDDYLKWVAGFANAHGGTLCVGKDDSGKVAGIPDAEKLLELLPNKIRDLLGVIPEINLHSEAGKEYLEIIVPPYSVPISLRGQFYYRTGSTLQELKGSALTEFLLKRVGRTWDDIIEPSASLAHLDENSIDQYRTAAAKAARLPEDVLTLPVAELLHKLRLIDDEGGLKRAALILFGKKPVPYTNMAVKMGRFKTDSELRFQEIEEGNLVHLLREVPAQLNRKFFVRPINFEGLQRVEKGEYPVAALREALLNALVHRDYSGTQVQLRVYDTMFTVWNEGFLPEGLTLDALRRQHPSRPRNPLIAEVCFKGGYIDAWGRGTLKIFESCAEAQLPEPEMKEEDGGMMVKLFKSKISPAQLARLPLTERQVQALQILEQKGKITSRAYQEHFSISASVAKEELASLASFGLIKKIGTRGPSVHYILG